MTSSAVPEAFLADVKEVLENLYDFAFLNRHPLAVTSPGGRNNEAAGHRLRRELIEAIEALKPSAAAGGRAYNLLNLHYIGGMTLPEAAASLGVSVRQAYRDLRQGHESVGYLLWYRRQSAAAPPPGQDSGQPGPADGASPESALPDGAKADGAFSEGAADAATPTDLAAVLETAAKAVSRLAERAGVALWVTPPPGPLVIATQQAAAQQVCIHVLSQAIQAAEPGPLAVTLAADGDAIALTLRFRPRQPGTPVPIDAAVAGFISRLRFRLAQAPPAPDGTACLTLHLAQRRPTLLVIDDHVGLGDLLQRFVAGRALEVVSATDALTGLKLALELQPSVVLVDLMMPGMDGWELLQRLRTAPELAGLPVIICSVINDPELAYSLGATLFLPKPLTRETLLAALATVGL